MKRSMAWMAAALIAALITAVGAQNAEKEANDTADAAETKPAPKSAAQQALEQLRQRRQENKLIEPTVTPPARQVSSPPVGALAPADLGFAVGQRKPTLRREGEFVIARRGRLVPAPKSNHRVFQFDADSEQSPEPPMVMLPCRLLESMENLVHQSGDQAAFNVTGQVFVYRGLNYLLPTMFTLAVDKGNFQ